jgi:hypothetical protein
MLKDMIKKEINLKKKHKKQLEFISQTHDPDHETEIVS